MVRYQRLFESDLAPGDWITYEKKSGRNMDGSFGVIEKKGRIVMKSSYPGSWVVNTGGRYGNPDVVDEGDIKRVKKGRRVGPDVSSMMDFTPTSGEMNAGAVIPEGMGNKGEIA